MLHSIIRELVFVLNDFFLVVLHFKVQSHFIWLQSCWWLTVGDNFRMLARIKILVTSLGCWCPTLVLRYRGCWWPKRLKPSPTSENCHQHISSPTSVTSIDVAKAILYWGHIFRPTQQWCWWQCYFVSNIRHQHRSI